MCLDRCFNGKNYHFPMSAFLKFKTKSSFYWSFSHHVCCWAVLSFCLRIEIFLYKWIFSAIVTPIDFFKNNWIHAMNKVPVTSWSTKNNIQISAKTITCIYFLYFFYCFSSSVPLLNENCNLNVPGSYFLLVSPSTYDKLRPHHVNTWITHTLALRSFIFNFNPGVRMNFFSSSSCLQTKPSF